MRLPGSLRARIVLAAVAAVGVCGTLAGGLLLASVERDGRNQADAELRARVDSILRTGDSYGRRRGGPDTLLRGSGTFAQVAFDNQVENAGDVPANPPDVPQEAGFTTIDINGTPWRSLTVGIGQFGNAT